MNLNQFSTSPGCYLMKDNKGKIIYIGKAKNLKKRLSQYFKKERKDVTNRILSLINNIDSVETIITSNEKEALLLEANLVKKYKPKYNVLLKDDKHFPYVKLNLKNHPKLEIAREVKHDESKYFGPFSDSSAAYKSIDLLNQIIPIRKCNKLPKKECLYYHMGMCVAPCINKIEQKTYDKYISQIIDFYNGKQGEIRKKLLFKMQLYAKKLEYERANEYKQMLEYLSNIGEKQKVDFSNDNSIDFFAFHSKQNSLLIANFIYRNGILVGKKTFFYEEINDIKEALELFLISYYKQNTKPKELVLPSFLNLTLLAETLQIRVNNYEKGKKSEVLNLLGENAIEELNKKLKSEESYKQNLFLLSEKLGIKQIEDIDLFDVSHFHGDQPVGAKVNFYKSGFNKKNYRKYIIKKENAGNDYLSIKEIIYRRLYKIIENEEYTPDLIIVDGGFVQLKAAKEVKKELNLDNIVVCGLAKDNNHITSYLINEQNEKIYLDKKAPLYYFLVNLQDEVHRFALSFHSYKRNKSMKKSVLDDIKGLGLKRKKILLEKYKTIENLKEITTQELSQYLPMNVAIRLKDKIKN